MYLTFTEYQSMGGKLDQAQFLRAEFAVRMKINAMTYNRIRDESPVQETVKWLVLDIVEKGYCGSLDGQDITSVSNDGRSMSFSDDKGKAERLIRDCLENEVDQFGIPLLYAGNV